MSQTNPADSDAVAESGEDIVDVPDDSALQSAGETRFPGRPASVAWTNLNRISNPSPGNYKHKYLFVRTVDKQSLQNQKISANMHQTAERAAQKPAWPLKCNRSKREEGEETAASFLLTAVVTAASFPKAITRRCSVCWCWLSSCVASLLLALFSQP